MPHIWLEWCERVEWMKNKEHANTENLDRFSLLLHVIPDVLFACIALLKYVQHVVKVRRHYTLIVQEHSLDAVLSWAGLSMPGILLRYDYCIVP
jgi:hypothetical protein